MEGAADKTQQSLFRWSDEDTEGLIRWRGKNEHLFTGRRNAAILGFQTFIVEKELGGKIEAQWVKKKWENIKQKYKDLKAPKTGVSTEGGEATAASWKWFDVMDEVMGQRPSITPPNLISSAVASTSAAVASPPEQGSSTKRKRDPEWVPFMREMQEKDEEKERKAEERDERREREREEREEKRERERREDNRAREKEWREWMENRSREERAEREERERESRAREERLVSLLEALAKK